MPEYERLPVAAVDAPADGAQIRREQDQADLNALTQAVTQHVLEIIPAYRADAKVAWEVRRAVRAGVGCLVNRVTADAPIDTGTAQIFRRVGVKEARAGRRREVVERAFRTAEISLSTRLADAGGALGRDAHQLVTEVHELVGELGALSAAGFDDARRDARSDARRAARRTARGEGRRAGLASVPRGDDAAGPPR